MIDIEANNSYVSDLAISFDEARELYIGDFFSQGHPYRVESSSRSGLHQEMEYVLYHEYMQMQRDVTFGKSQEQEKQGRSRGGGSSSDNSESRSRDNDSENDKPVNVIDADNRNTEHARLDLEDIKNASTWADLVSGGLAVHSGNWYQAGISIMSVILGDWYEGVESFWTKKVKKKLFSVSFGGVLITAKSKRELKKKLQRQRNKRIHIIMMSVRKAGLIKDKKEDDSSETRGESESRKRLQNKKKRAQLLSPRKWEMRVAPQGQETGWRNKSTNLRERIKDKKNRSRGLWAHRLG